MPHPPSARPSLAARRGESNAPPAALPEPLARAGSHREGGIGLGMPIVRQIVEGHGGEVEAGNAPGGGAVVRLRFPLAGGGAAEAVAGEAAR